MFGNATDTGYESSIVDEEPVLGRPGSERDLEIGRQAIRGESPSLDHSDRCLSQFVVPGLRF